MKNALIRTLNGTLISACLITAMASCSGDEINSSGEINGSVPSENERTVPLALKDGSCTKFTRSSAIIDSASIS